jgi:hypothetical protein
MAEESRLLEEGQVKFANATDVFMLMTMEPGYADIEVAIETGLFRGATASICAPLFREYHGIEINPGHISLCRRQLGEMGIDIVYHEGDTRRVLPEVLLAIREPALIMLDAHYSFVAKGKLFADEADTVHGPEGADFPLLEELRAISKRPYADIVLVDDTSLFGKNVPVLRAPDVTGKPGDTLPQWESMTHAKVEQTLGRIVSRQDWKGATIYWRSAAQ